MKPVEIQLEPARTISGKVVDPDGQPVRGAMLQLQSRRWPWPGASIVSMETDEEGKFSWSSAPSKAVTFRVLKPGFETVIRRLTPGSSDHLIKLTPAPKPELREKQPNEQRRPGYDPFKIFRRIS